MIAVSTVVLDGHDLARGAEILASLGIRAVEVAYIEGYMPFDEGTFTERNGQGVARLFADQGIRIAAMSAHTDLGLGDGVRRLLRRLDFATGADIGTVISNATTLAARDRLTRCIDQALPGLQAAGVILALENPGHGQAALLPNGQRGAAFVAKWDSPWLRLNYDIGNACSYSQGRIDLAADLATARPWSCRLHLKDLDMSGADWTFCPLGQGSVGYGDRMPISALAGLDLTLEHPIRLWRPGGGDPRRRAHIPDEDQIRRALSASLGLLGAQAA